MSFHRLAALAAVGLLPLVAQAAPSHAQVRQAYRASDAVLLDRHGDPVQGLRVDLSVRRMPWVALADISPALAAAVLQAEDQRFHEHGGVDLGAIGKAAWDNLFRQRPRGASTITMQLASLLDPTLHPDAGKRSWRQKWDQAGAARELEAGWTKAQILEAYLNLVPFRGELQGIAAVSHKLFGKVPSGLNHAESLILGSLIRAPNAEPKVVLRRACTLAREMAATASCTGIEMTLALALSRSSTLSAPEPAAQVAQRLLKRPGERVASTIDGPLQRFAQASLRQQLRHLAERNVGDGAVVVLDNASGEILAYVGNSGEKSVDGVAAPRQAGSTLKPFLYGLAIEKRLLTAASVLDDSPADIATGAGLYVPRNYDHGYKGHASVRTSLGNSLNIPAVRTLMLLGLEPFYQRLLDLRITSLTEPAEFYGYSLALGSAEVSLLELSNAYRALANGGLAGPARLVPGPAPAQRRVMAADAAHVIGDILSDRAARSITFGLSSQLATPFWTAVKTGTSKDMRDNWAVGYSARYTVGVWVGNFDGAPMWDVSGVSGAAPIWRDVMEYLHAGVPSRQRAAPAGVLRAEVAFLPAFEAPRSELFLAGTERSVVEVAGARGAEPAISYPARDSILALDPDIPAARQRVVFRAQAGAGLRWQLDGRPVGEAGTDLVWEPVPGMHVLALVDGGGTPIDTVRFQVRGNESAAR